jgi:hypothetical protein
VSNETWAIVGVIAVASVVVATAIDAAAKQLAKIADTLNDIRYRLDKDR